MILFAKQTFIAVNIWALLFLVTNKQNDVTEDFEAYQIIIEGGKKASTKVGVRIMSVLKQTKHSFNITSLKLIAYF